MVAIKCAMNFMNSFLATALMTSPKLSTHFGPAIFTF